MRSRERARSRWIVLLALPVLIPLVAAPGYANGLQGDSLRYDFSDDVSFELGGYYRFRFTHVDGMVLSQIPTGERAGEQQVLGSMDYTEHRLRVEPKVTLFEKLSLNLQVDLLSGMVSGSTAGRSYMWFAQREQRWNQRDGFDFDDFMDYRFRRFWAAWDSPLGLLQVGRQGSHWGLGMLTNDGNGFRNEWGDAYYGDSADRVLFGTKPYSIFSYLFRGEKPARDPLTVAFAYDWRVARDSTLKLASDKRVLPRASIREGEIQIVPGVTPRDDRAHQYVASIQIDTTNYENRAPFKVGFYAARRYMDHQNVLVPPAYKPPEEFLRVWVFDLYGSLTVKPRSLDGWLFFLEGEIATITGETNFQISRALAEPGDPFPVSNVTQLGWTLRGGVRYKNRFELDLLNLGYASGDSDPFDDQVRNFRFHPDYNVGMILFEDVLANMSSASAYNATTVFGEGGPVPTLGTDYIPNNGSVTNAFYVNPILRVYPLERLEAKLGVLWARTATNFVDPSFDFLYGGGFGEYNSLGGPSTNTNYGWEISFGLKYTLDWRYTDLVLGVQYGHFFPGNVFQNAQGKRMSDIDKVQTRITLLW